MKPAMGGYTLLEVMLFLAVSVVFLALSNQIIRGQTARTEFVTSMNDVTTKMQQWINQVQSGYTAYSSNTAGVGTNYSCSAATGKPVLSTGGANANKTGTNLDCIFLGKAIMLNDNSSPNLSNKIYAYTVIGNRTYINGGINEPVKTLKQAVPTAAIYPVNSGSPNINLTEEYTIPNGTYVRHAWTTNPAPAQQVRLGAFYIDPSSATNAIRTVEYPFKQNADPKAWSTEAWRIPECINLTLNGAYGNCRLNPGDPENLWPMNVWNICFENRRDDERALLQIISSSGTGATTKLQIGKDNVCS